MCAIGRDPIACTELRVARAGSHPDPRSIRQQLGRGPSAEGFGGPWPPEAPLSRCDAIRDAPGEGSAHPLATRTGGGGGAVLTRFFSIFDGVGVMGGLTVRRVLSTR